MCLRSLCIWVPAGFPSSGLVLSDGPESALVVGFTVCPATCHKSTFSFSAQPLRQTPCLSFTLLPKLEITVAFMGHSPYLSDKQPAPRSESEPPPQFSLPPFPEQLCVPTDVCPRIPALLRGAGLHPSGWEACRLTLLFFLFWNTAAVALKKKKELSSSCCVFKHQGFSLGCVSLQWCFYFITKEWFYAVWG